MNDRIAFRLNERSKARHRVNSAAYVELEEKEKKNDKLSNIRINFLSFLYTLLAGFQSLRDRKSSYIVKSQEYEINIY